MILSRLLKKVNLTKPIIDETIPQHTYALHHLASDKVWVSQTRVPVALIKRVQLVDCGVASAIKSFPAEMQRYLKATSNKKIDLYLGNSSVASKTYLLDELMFTGNLLIPGSIKQIKKIVWVIRHKPSGYYKVFKVSDIHQTADELLLSFIYTLNPYCVAYKVLGMRVKSFLDNFKITLDNKKEFEVIKLEEVKEVHKANVVMNDYIRTNGYDLCMNTLGVGRIAKGSVSHH